MKLTVKNFGPIKEAKNINLSPMTIFVGPSNTGKSYLAMLIYSIMKALDDGDFSYEFYQKLKTECEKINMGSSESYDNKKAMLPRIDKIFSWWTKMFSDSWKLQMIHCFGEEGNNLLTSKNIDVKISVGKDSLVMDLVTPFNNKLDQKQREKLFTIINKEMSDFENYMKNAFEKSDRDDHEMEMYYSKLQEVLIGITHNLFPSITLDDRDQNPGGEITYHYLPAIRGTIMDNYHAFISTSIRGAAMAGLNKVGKSSSVPLFTGILYDFLEKLFNIAQTNKPSVNIKLSELDKDGRKKLKEIERIGWKIEQKIMAGQTTIYMSETPYHDFRYRFQSDDKTYDLPLINASSMVSELAPVALFIRHYLNPGDLFIIEEPEAHLHPKAQRDISGILVGLVNAGVHVLVTTHSDYVLEQIGNFINAETVDEKIKGQSLNEEKISVYRFDKPRNGKHKKTIVKTIKFDPYTGFLPQDHLDVSTDLYNETVELMDKKESNND